MSIQDSLFYINKSLLSSQPAEKQLQSYRDVTLEDEYRCDKTMRVTSHRIIFFSKNDHAFLVDGEKISEIILAEHGMLWNKEYFIKLRTNYGKLKIFMKNFKEAHVTISGMIKTAAWKLNPVSEKPVGMYTGIFSKLQKEKQKIDQNAMKVGSSFTSFDTLFANLREIKDVMKDMRQNTNEGEEGSGQVGEILKDIGFVSVISKQESGRDYYRHLAQDFYNICQNTLFKKYGGIVPILDLFYFYNKKRQMQLISPQQLLTACQQFHKFGFHAKLVSYPNNIKVIESTHFNQEKDFEQNYKVFFNDYSQGYSAQEISRRQGQPLAIVQIKLKKALRRGALALDNRIQGEKYYKNLLLKC